MQLIVTIVVTLLSIGIGALTLGFGRRMYAVFTGVAGLILTLLVLEWLFGDEQILWLWAAALVVGVVVGYLAPRYERIALIGAGFALGGYVALFLAVDNGRVRDHTYTSTAIFLIGALIGAWSVHRARDRALIVLSSLTGAAFIVGGLQLSSALQAASFAGLAAAGMLFQSRTVLLPPIEPRGNNAAPHVVTPSCCLRFHWRSVRLTCATKSPFQFQATGDTL